MLAKLHVNLHNVKMEKANAVKILNDLLKSRAVTRSSIAKRLGIHPSQVSRIASGQFIRLDGHALKVCKFAQSIASAEMLRRNMPTDRTTKLQNLLAQLLEQDPDAADGLELVLNSLVRQPAPSVLTKPR